MSAQLALPVCQRPKRCKGYFGPDRGASDWGASPAVDCFLTQQLGASKAEHSKTEQPELDLTFA